MVALPDPERASKRAQDPAEGDAAHPDNGGPGSSLPRALRIGAGGTLVLIAFGLWIVSPMDGDGAMFLIKLVFSVTLLCMGAVFLMLREADDRPSEIQFDPAARQIRVIRSDGMSAQPGIEVHDIDALADVSLHDSVLTARAADGRLVLAMHVSDPKTEAVLRRALGL